MTIIKLKDIDSPFHDGGIQAIIDFVGMKFVIGGCHDKEEPNEGD